MRADDDLSLPWLRAQLVDSLSLLGDMAWLQAAVSRPTTPAELDDLLDFLDDSGVVADPESRVGGFLLEREVPAARSLGVALDAALGTDDEGLWVRVSSAADILLRTMQSGLGGD